MSKGVEYRHNDSAKCLKLAQEKAGTSLLGYLYRFEWDKYHRCLLLQAFRICKKTPKGYRILLRDYNKWSVCDTKTKLVISAARKAFARTTVEAALESYRRRKTSYVAILEDHLRTAKEQLYAADLPKAYQPSERLIKKELAFLVNGELLAGLTNEEMYKELIS